MTKFEYMINNGKFTKNTIDVLVIDIDKDTTFSAVINAKNLSEVDSKLPKGFEMDKITTLQNYFDNDIIAKFELEIDNSQHVYFSDFESLIDGGFYEYTKALEKDLKLADKMDRKFQG